tara:strand:+ start:93 stop:503 length:411 start_codon:yes stop_codon:yes gene_type:complete
MADDDSKGNVIKGPWKRVKKVSRSQTEKVTQDMVFIDDVAENVMIPLIHGLAENGVEIKSDDFCREIGFLNEVVRAILFRHLGYKHDISELVSYIMRLRTERTEDVYASFDSDVVEKLNQFVKIQNEIEKGKKDDE